MILKHVKYINELTWQKEWQNCMTNNVLLFVCFWTKTVKTQQQQNKW